MTVVDFDQAARLEKRRKDAMSSRLLLLRLRKHHYDQAPDHLKFLPSPIVGNPIMNHMIDMFTKMPPPTARKMMGSARAVLALTARYYKISIDDILGPRRIPKVVRARKVAMYLAYDHTTESISKLSRTFCRDHSTLTHARNDVEEKLDTDKLLALQIATLRKQLEASLECPERTEVQRYRKSVRLTCSRWDMDSEVLLLQGVKAGKQWHQIGKEIGVSAAAACNKYIRLQLAKQSLEAAGV